MITTNQHNIALASLPIFSAKTNLGFFQIDPYFLSYRYARFSRQSCDYPAWTMQISLLSTSTKDWQDTGLLRMRIRTISNALWNAWNITNADHTISIEMRKFACWIARHSEITIRSWLIALIGATSLQTITNTLGSEFYYNSNQYCSATW